MGVYNLQYINEFFGEKLVGPSKYIVAPGGSKKAYKKGDRCYPHKTDVANTEKDAFINYLKRNYKAEVSENTIVIRKKYDYILDFNFDIVKIRNPHASRKINPDQVEATYESVVYCGSCTSICKKYNLKIDTTGKASNDEENETKLRKAELKKVVTYAKSAIKSIRDKFGNDMDFKIIIDVDDGEAEDFYDQDTNSVIISKGGLYDENSKTEGRRHVEEENISKRNKIFNEAIKAINAELKIDKSIRGKVTDDWDHYDFLISYDL